MIWKGVFLMMLLSICFVSTLAQNTAKIQANEFNAAGKACACDKSGKDRDDQHEGKTCSGKDCSECKAGKDGDKACSCDHDHDDHQKESDGKTCEHCGDKDKCTCDHNKQVSGKSCTCGKGACSCGKADQGKSCKNCGQREQCSCGSCSSQECKREESQKDSKQSDSKDDQDQGRKPTPCKDEKVKYVSLPVCTNLQTNDK